MIPPAGAAAPRQPHRQHPVHEGLALFCEVDLSAKLVTESVLRRASPVTCRNLDRRRDVALVRAAGKSNGFRTVSDHDVRF